MVDAGPDVLFALIQRIERQMEAAADTQREIETRLTRIEAALEHRPRPAGAPQSADERQTVAVLAWLAKNWQGLVALAAAAAWLLTALGAPE